MYQERNKGEGILEYTLILLLVLVVIVAILSLVAPQPPCDRSRPTAGQVVDCVATRTAEAHNK